MERYSRNFKGWADAAKARGLHEFAKQLREDNQGTKDEILAKVKALGLPVQDSTILPLTQFVHNPQATLDAFTYPLYWATALPIDPSQDKDTVVGVTGEGLIEHALQFSANAHEYDYLINQFEVNLFGGQIISNEHLVVLEMAEGNQQKFVQSRDHGKVFSARATLVDHTPVSIPFRYSTQDQEIRAMMWKALSYLQIPDPNRNWTRDVKFHPGYFEFAITKNPTGDEPGVTFFDYKDSPTFLNITQ